VALLRDRLDRGRGELAEAGVGEPHRLEPAKTARARRQAFRFDLGLHVDNAADFGEEPGIDLARRMNLRVGHAVPHGLGDFENSVGRGRSERTTQ
jgi:hypothetical protein